MRRAAPGAGEDEAPTSPGTSASRAAWASRLDVGVLAALGVLVGVVGWRSLRWEGDNDVPIMMYQAFLANTYGWLPYRDVFDMNMGGSYLLYALVGRVFGYQDMALRVADLCLMAGIGLVTWRAVRRWSSASGVLAALVFSAWWLRGGIYLELQREVFAVLFIALSTWAAWSDLSAVRRAALTGLGFGVAATIKPDLALGVLPLAVLLVTDPDLPDLRARLRVLAAGAGGVLLPVLIMLVVFGALGVFDEFFAGLEYLAYYGDFSGDRHVFAGPGEKLRYKLDRLVALGGHWPMALFAVAVVSLRVAASGSAQARRLASLLGLVVVFALYPFNGGHFWTYHYAPLVWACAVGVGQVLALPVVGPRPDWGWGGRAALVVFLIYFTGALQGFVAFHDRNPKLRAFAKDAPIAAYLREHLRPGDRVQPMDWVEAGVVKGLMKARAEAGTRFIYDFHFYHHVSTPYIQGLRRQFLEELEAVRPRFVVRGTGKTYFTGQDGGQPFPALDQYLERRYRVVDGGRRGDGYTIFERRPGRQP